MRTIPFIRSLGPDFYGRLIFFIGVSYFVTTNMLASSNEGKVELKSEEKSSSTRYSHTFAREKQLDEILVKMDGQTEEEKQSKDKDLFN